jgi:hypothetical protein
VFFGNVTYGPCDVFIFIFNSVKLSLSLQLRERQDPQLSGKKQNEASLSGSISVNFFVQKSIFWPKKHFLANEICALLKN